MKKHIVITIARSYGSGGRTLGKLLAEELGIPCYDRELLRLASEKSGINEALFGKVDEQVKSSPFFRGKRKIYDGEVRLPDDPKYLSDENLFNIQAQIIRELAEKESCVIIGRAADYSSMHQEKILSDVLCLRMAEQRRILSKKLRNLINSVTITANTIQEESGMMQKIMISA